MKRLKKQKLDNKGSALLTVIVVVAFITILATTMLYITSMNVQMKQTDYQNKQSFYKAEEALDALKAELATEMSVALEHAYQEVMIQYANLGADERQAVFRAAFLDKLNENWSKLVNDAGCDMTVALQNLVPEYQKNFVFPIVSDGENAPSYFVDTEKARFILKNVRVRYAEDGYSSFICTDIVLCVPKLKLEHDQSSGLGVDEEIPAREKIELADYIIYGNWSKY